MTTSKNTTTKDVAVVIGAGGIGQAIARRQGSGKLVLLADLNEQVLKSATEALEAGGHEATTRRWMCQSVSRSAHSQTQPLSSEPSRTSSTPRDSLPCKRRRKRSLRSISSARRLGGRSSNV
jgi:hypothetical protein